MTFELDMDKIKEQSLQFVEMAKKTAVDLADKGKNQLDLINEQTQLSKAERQLGALVYSLHKSGEENQPLLDKYLENIEEIHARIEAIKARMTPAEADEAAKTAADTADDGAGQRGRYHPAGAPALPLLGFLRRFLLFRRLNRPVRRFPISCGP